jgi:hypothetical protein
MRKKKGPRSAGNFKPDKRYHNMASTYYDWHLASSQNRMQQKPLSVDAVRVAKYHYKNGLVLTFCATTGKQLAILLDDRDATIIKKQILGIMPDDEVTRLRVAMTCITNMAKRLRYTTHTQHHMELIEAIMETAGSWPEIAEQAIDAHALTTRVEQLENQVRDMRETANQLVGIQAWIADEDMKKHCTKCIDKLTK